MFYIIDLPPIGTLLEPFEPPPPQPSALRVRTEIREREPPARALSVPHCLLFLPPAASSSSCSRTFSSTPLTNSSYRSTLPVMSYSPQPPPRQYNSTLNVDCVDGVYRPTQQISPLTKQVNHLAYEIPKNKYANNPWNYAPEFLKVSLRGFR